VRMVSGLSTGGLRAGPGDVGFGLGGVVDAGDVEAVKGAELGAELGGVGEFADGGGGSGVPAAGDFGLHGGVEFLNGHSHGARSFACGLGVPGNRDRLPWDAMTSLLCAAYRLH
jgi:hypothetical protein